MDPEDPTVIAENELLGAAAAIEAAAKKLEQLKPRAKPKVSPAPFSPPLRMPAPSASSYSASLSATSLSFLQEADESLNFEEQILEAAKSIAAATSALVKAASAAQRELVAQGKVRTWIPAALPSTCMMVSSGRLLGGHTSEQTPALLRRWAPFQPTHWMMDSGPRASSLL